MSDATKSLLSSSLADEQKPLIREVKKSEIETLSQLASRTYTDTYAHTFENKKELEKIIKETRSEAYFEKVFDENTILVAEHKGSLIGYAQFGPVDLPLELVQPGDQELVRLYVLKEFQGRGVGKSLLNAVLTYPQMKQANNIYLDVWLKNESAQKFYRLFGFENQKVAGEDLIMVRRNPRQF